MKVCTHKGLIIAVLTRNEHCPPHVHVGTDEWDARFEFSFWHNGVRLWDVVPAKNQPKAPLLEELRQVIMQPQNLRKAREAWWNSVQSVCLENQIWDSKTEEVIDSKNKRPRSSRIKNAYFDGMNYKTVLYLVGESDPVEILL